MVLLTSLFSALIAAGTFIKIPLGPVPITLQTFFVYLAGLLLPPLSSFSSVFTWVALGALGLPLFTSGGGLGALMAPTGGFIIGALLSVIPGSLLAKKKHNSFLYNILILLVMSVVIYVPGILWLKYKLTLDLKNALLVGLVPFIPGDTIKIITASLASKALYPETLKLRERLKHKEDE